MAFMHEGGVAMWATLILFLIAGGVAVARRSKDGWQIALAGAVLVTASGLLGFSTGLYATMAHSAGMAAERHVEIMGIGLRESVNNTIFGALLAAGLTILAVTLARGTRTPAPV